MDGITLSNGTVMPYLGYGTGVVNHYAASFPRWAKQKLRLVLSSAKHMRPSRQLKIDLFASQMVRDAYDAGFRLFDTGRIYGDSELAIGKGLKGIARENYFICTKFSDLCYEMLPKGQDVIFHLKKSLDFLQTDYVDLLLIHHPHGDVAKIWAEMEKAYEAGLCRAIGTSNFNVSDFEELKKTQRIAPMVNQGERHPFFTNNDVYEYCRQNNIVFMAHTPTGRSKAVKSALLSELGKKYHKTNQQIILRWHYQNGVVPVLSTVNKDHMAQTNNIFDFELTEQNRTEQNRTEQNRNRPNNLSERQHPPFGLSERSGQPSLQIQQIKTVCFGTNITMPTLFGGGKKQFIKSLLEYVRKVIKPDKAVDWGKRATLNATRSLIPCVKEAVENGITVFDCSRAYGGSEKRLAMALKSVEREKVFLITKINDASQFSGKVEECFAESLQQLGTDYVDLLLLHWPVNYPKSGDERLDKSVPVYVRSWKVLEHIYKSGRAKAIGVANFSVKQLELIKEYAEIMPMANEFECHPLCIRRELNDYCQDNGIKVFAYAAFCAMDKRLVNEEMQKIAEKHKKTIAQVILKWHVQHGRVPIFGTTKTERIREYASLDFVLSEDELAIIDSQNINYRAYPDSEHCDFTKGIWLGWEDYKDCCP